MITERNDVTERLNQVYATESSALDPVWRAVMAASLSDEDWSGPTTLKEYAELHDLTLDAEVYQHELPEDEPFTHPTNDE